MSQLPKLLILDLDETLIFATETRLDSTEGLSFSKYFIYLRPGLDDFISFATRTFRVAVWSSSASDYADAIVRRIFNDRPLEFVWTRERCTLRVDPDLVTRYWVKDLKKVRRRGYSIEDILVVDDTASKLERNYGNHIRIAPFLGDPADHELEHLQRYLVTLKDEPNVRSIDKRFWRSQQ